MKKIIVIGASTSSTSINKKLVRYAASHIQNVHSVEVEINDFEMPIYSIDKEKNGGIPNLAHDFLALFSEFDGLILSTAEHNRNICAGFKNILDWCSRIDVNIFKEKPILLLSTSPGGYGGKNARNAMEIMLPQLKGKIVSTFSLPKFHSNFSENKIIDSTLENDFFTALKEFKSQVGIE